MALTIEISKAYSCNCYICKPENVPKVFKILKPFVILSYHRLCREKRSFKDSNYKGRTCGNKKSLGKKSDKWSRFKIAFDDERSLVFNSKEITKVKNSYQSSEAC